MEEEEEDAREDGREGGATLPRAESDDEYEMINHEGCVRKTSAWVAHAIFFFSSPSFQRPPFRVSRSFPASRTDVDRAVQLCRASHLGILPLSPLPAPPPPSRPSTGPTPVVGRPQRPVTTTISSPLLWAMH